MPLSGFKLGKRIRIILRIRILLYHGIKKVRKMIFSKRSRYGLRALIDLAQHDPNESVQLNEIANRNGISVKYLEQIFAALRKSGIIGSIKGPQGGYFLAKPSGNLTVAEVVMALDGIYFLDREEMPDNEEGEAPVRAIQTKIIDPLNKWLDEFLNSLTLKELADCSEKYKTAFQNMYYI